MKCLIVVGLGPHVNSPRSNMGTSVGTNRSDEPNTLLGLVEVTLCSKVSLYLTIGAPSAKCALIDLGVGTW